MKLLKLLLIFSFANIGLVSLAQTRLVIDPHAHSGIVNDMIFTSNGDFLISASDDKTIRIWDVESGELDRTIRAFSGSGSNGAIYAMALSPDDRFLAIGGYSDTNEIKLIDLERKTEVVLLNGHTNIITSLCFSSDGLQLASADATGLVKIWSISFSGGKIVGKSKVNLIGHKEPVYDIAFSPNGKQIVSASNDGLLKLWNLDTDTNKPIEMRMHIDKVRSCAFSADGKWIVSGGNKGKVVVWDNRGAFSKYLGAIEESVRDIKIVEDKVLVSGSKGYLYSLKSGISLGQLAMPFSVISASAFYSSSLAAFAGGAQGSIIVYDLTTGDTVQIFRNKTPNIKSVAISSDGQIGFRDKKGNLNNAFDLSSTSFMWAINKTNDFVGDIHQEGAYKLSRFDDYTLSTGFSGTVKMSKKVDGRVRSFSIIDENTIAVGGDYSLKLYSRESDFKGTLEGFNGAITSIASANNRIIALCQDQTIRVWNQSTFELLASIYIAPKNDWICWTPQGFYEASSGGEKYMGWQLDESADVLSKFYRSSVFSTKFHNPALVKETLALGAFSLAEEKLKVIEVAKPKNESKVLITLAVSKEKVIKSAPVITWILPEVVSTTQSEAKISIKAIIKSSSKIKTVKILVNGRPSTNSRGIIIPKSVGEFDMVVEQEIILASDISEIRIFVANQEAKMVSEKRVIKLEGVDARGKGRSLNLINYSDRPDLYLLTIGVSEYQNTEYNLNYADNDAESITEIFEKLGTEVYKSINSVKLLNSKADKQSILDAFDNLTRKVQAKDMVVIFIASHGINKAGKFYIIPYDADLIEKPENVVSWQELTQTLGGLPSNVLIMIDACRSGQLGVNLTQSVANNTEALRNASNDENGLVLMAASTGSESALETPEWEHGAFTLALLEGIKEGKADIKPDGTIFLRELDYYVSERTIELTNNVQHPTTQKPSTISRMSIINLNK